MLEVGPHVKGEEAECVLGFLDILGTRDLLYRLASLSSSAAAADPGLNADCRRVVSLSTATGVL